VNSIMIQEGNATDHLTADDQALLNEVIAMIRNSMYSSMTAAHNSDEAALAAAIAAINQCYMDFAARIADGGDLAEMESSVRTHQEYLNELQDDVDAKTVLNTTAWNTLESHMSLISDAPACPALPNPRTMPSLDIYFESSAYVTWWTAQKAAYEPLRDAYVHANQQLEAALTAYAVGLAVRNVAYCDWKRELEAACAQFSACYEAAKAHYLNVVKPAVEEDMRMRIEAYKAGETIIHQIRFLLAEEADQATPAINTDVYQIAFPEVPAKPACDMSALDDPAWVPTPDCHDEKQLVNGCSTRNGAPFAQYGTARMEGGNQVAGEAICCDASNRCTRHIRDGAAWFLTSLSHEHCTTDSTGVIVENQTPPSHSFHQAKAMCHSVGWRLPKTQAEVDSTCGTGCHIDGVLVWIEPDAPPCRPGEDIVAGTFQHFGHDGPSSSDQECNERCQNTAGCTAWVRGRSPGTSATSNAHCWLTRQVPPVWEADSSRVAGVPGCV